MVSVLVTYEDGKCNEHLHITRISYNGSNKTMDIPENDLITHHFPIGKTLWLHSSNSVSVVSGSGLRLVDIRQE